MNRASLVIITIITGLTLLLWFLLNQPEQEPPWPAQVQGFSFSPMRQGQSPVRGELPSVEEIDQDLALLAEHTHAVRVYAVSGTLGAVPRLARKYGLNVALGAWIDSRLENNEKELSQLIEITKHNWRNVVRVFVGNEVLLHNLVPYNTLVGYLDRARAALDTPVSVAEPWHVWLTKPDLVKHVDFIGVHLLPYWEGVDVDKAVDFSLERLQDIRNAYPDKPIVIAEVGWPSNGRTRNDAQASLANQASFLRRFLARAEEQKLTYYVMEAFDQPWKRATEGGVGTYWGVYDVNREPKFSFTQPILDIPHWRQLAAISVLIAVIMLALLFRDSGAMRSRGRTFLALITYGIATLAVWLVYDYSLQYMTLPMVIVGVVMLVAMLGVILVLLAEAHEWAESLWLHEWRRSFNPADMAKDALPFVSIHVPAYNEPPDMLNETLDALAALDYPNYEVVVVDNNTKDPAVWQPVQAHCAELGPQFRFFHVDPLSGFKAGALNYALRETDPRAEIVAVIDSDYEVSPDWLCHLVPAFADPKVGIVQAPQDYRDGEQNAFKALCLAEYRGFFHIGMVTRNERNAIIQHGTMTMVRRSALAEVEGWGEWCITEDAELGLKIFEKGHEALYIPRSYGQGLMPDSFLDFKKQRFRWAYGAVIILRAHLAELLGVKPSALTAGQRYHFVAGWLPWMADGFNLIFNMAALAWTTGMVVAPHLFEPPLMIFAVLPLALFGFKVLKLLTLYRRRVRATARQSVGAALAGLALSHTIARAMLTGLFTRKIGFFRTPKMANAPALLRALADASEEGLLCVAMWLGAWSALHVQDATILDVRIWSLVLVVQSLPYVAAVLLSLISALRKLPARLVGVMSPIQEGDQSGGKSPVRSCGRRGSPPSAA